jgi:RNA polymerase sigma-70 factor (ECF subfamily)
MATDPDATDSDFALASRVASGDRAALGRLIDRHKDRLLFIVRQRLGPALRRKLESGDILQSALLAAIKDYSTAARPEDAFLPWIATVIEHTIRDRARWFRRHRRDTAREEPLDDITSEFIDPASKSPSGVFTLSEDLRRLERTLDRLPRKERELVILAKFEGRSTADIATILGKSPEAAKRAVSRAIAHLALEMGE